MAVRPLPSTFTFNEPKAAPIVNTLLATDSRVKQLTPRDREKLTNRPVYHARYATRQRRGVYRPVDARGSRELFDAALNVIGHSSLNIMAHIKFVLMRNPKLISARAEVILFEALYQLATPDVAEWMDANREALQQVFSIAPISSVVRAIPALRNGDGDVEANNQGAWDEWQRPKGPKPGQTVLAIEKRLRLQWVRVAHTADSYIREANIRRQNPDAKLIPLAPILSLNEQFPPKQPRPLRPTTIPAVQNAP